MNRATTTYPPLSKGYANSVTGKSPVMLVPHGAVQRRSRTYCKNIVYALHLKDRSEGMVQWRSLQECHNTEFTSADTST
ncbi:hypothetical protein TNCV_1072301 [Trichonephila clavipes]|nr:hypothetical protein TNCV_1072301 [Trichonephila clavipes]